MNKIDRRRTYYLMIDTETANTKTEVAEVDRNNALVYDIGFAIIDKYGNIYRKFSYIVKDVFFDMQVMNSAYYKSKIPQYIKDIEEGTRIVTTYYEVRKIIADLLEEYEVKAVIAHNALFDYCATNATERYLTKSKYRYFFPYGTVFYDTLKMASDVICTQKTYINWCAENGYMTKHKTPRPKATAEILYRYIKRNEEFVESHTALEDVLIETEIFAHCMRQHKKMRKELFQNVEK